ncbi:hypothetical protein V501_07766 [Pseudogymnoascus sp. VKM F-4519 (FW-2642)]|nr:hypothetical protein V501_07766 [Pseudogymnoascus sp. VKM F-4519 (FW-2642)]
MSDSRKETAAIPPLSARTNTEKQTQNSENRNRNEKNGQSSKEGQSDAYELTGFNHPPNHTTADDDDFEAREARRLAKRVEKLARREEEFEMKFSHSIQFNAVPDWSSHYIAYSNLKKLIYQLEKNQNQQNAQTTDAEASPLLAGNVDPDQIFTRALDVELEKISSFYQIKELEIFSEISELLSQQEEYDAEMQENGMEGSSDVHDHPRRPSSFYRGNTRNARPLSTATRSMTDDVDDSDEEDDEETALHRRKPEARRSMTAPSDVDGSHGQEDMWNSTAELNRRSSVAAYDDYANEAFSLYYSSGISLKKNTVSVYVQLCELKSFIQLNQTGFRKVLKKYDKILDRNLREKYMSQTVAPSYVFRPSTIKHVEENIGRMETIYADVVTAGDLTLAKKELRLHLREHVVWERNTVWREMIGIERKAQAANMGIRRTLLGADPDPSHARLQGDDEGLADLKGINTPVGRMYYPAWLFSSTMLVLLLIISIFILLLIVPIMANPEQQNCLAMLVFVSLLWATEVIPLFVTSLLIPFLCVILRVVRSDDAPHHRLGAKPAAAYIFAAMWTPVIMLLLGGFTIAAALSKYDIAKRIATLVLSKAGTRPRTVLVTNMFVAAFASMWISNVAAPVLCFSIIQPMLRNLPSDSNMSKALILGIALASNVGGMLSPIASPQNIIALAIMSPQPSWAIWFFIAIPVGVISLLLIWVLLLASFKPGKGTTIVAVRPVKDPFSGIQWFISLVTLATIVLWCVSHQLEHVLGDMGVVAIIPLVLFFGTGILTKEDFNNFLWTIIILAAGGLALGKAVNSSGLLHTIAASITDAVEGLSLYSVLVVFATLILVVATFISHTVAALIILPLVHSVGIGMENPHPNLLVMGGALMCSAAMGLPTSGFPNMTAIMMEDSQTGQRYLQVKHFISRGVPSSVLTLLVVITVGYGAMLISNI